MLKSKFIMVNTEGTSMRNNLNKAGKEGWRFAKMEPFFQQQRMTASHGISKFLICLEENRNMVSFYRTKFIQGNSQGDFNFNIDDVNEYNDRMQKCGFEFRDYHHVIVLHLHPEYNTRRSMKGYLCLWEITLKKDMVNKMLERMKLIVEKIKPEINSEKLKGAPRPAVFAEIKDKAGEYRRKHAENEKEDSEMTMAFFRPDKDEEKIIQQVDAYEYLYKLVRRIIEFDNLELKKQMGKDWDEGLANIEPDIEEVINSLSYDIDLEILVEEILWSSQGNLIVSSLPE